MSTARKLKLTPQQYLEQERRAEFKSEFYAGEVFAMAGASRWHVRISGNFFGEARSLLKGQRCEPFTNDMRVLVDATGLYTYPDVIIVCGEAQFADNEFDTLLNPTVIVEVLSDSTEAWDRGRKAAHYRRLPSLQEYILIAQNEPRVEQYRRQQNGDWTLKETTDLDAEIKIPSVGIRILLREIYARVEWPASDSIDLAAQ